MDARKAALACCTLLAACGSPQRQAYLDDLTAVEIAQAEGRNAEATRLADALVARLERLRDKCPVLVAKARAFAAETRFGEALGAFAAARDACVGADDDSAKALFEMSLMVMDHSKDRSAAVPLLRAVVTRFPDSPAAKRAVVFLEDVVEGRSGRVGVVDEMRRLYGRAPRSGVAPFILFEGARALRDGGDAWSALALFDLLVRRHASSGLADDAGYEAGTLAMKLGRPWDAARYFQRVLARRESSLLFGSYDTKAMVESQLSMADATWAATRDADRALALFEEFLAEHPKGELAARAAFRCHEVLAEAGRAAESRAWLVRVVERFPRSDQAARARELLDAPPARPTRDTAE
jgi:tetratricopeptide (TPR) repeat protein